MRVSFRVTRARLTFLIAATVLMIAGGVAYATIPDNGVYTACKLNVSGTIRLIDPSLGNSSLLGHCTQYETQITWNQQGQPGPQGPSGPKGDKGDPGSGTIVGTTSSGGAPLVIFDSATFGRLVALAPAPAACHWNLINTTTHSVATTFRFVTGSLSTGSATVVAGDTLFNQGAFGRQVIEFSDGTNSKIVWLEGSFGSSGCVYWASASQ